MEGFSGVVFAIHLCRGNQGGPLGWSKAVTTGLWGRFSSALTRSG